MITSNTLIALTHPIAATAMGGILLLLCWVHKDLRFLMFFGLTYLAYGIANSLQVLLWPSSYLINYLLTGVLYAFAALTMYGGIIALDNSTYWTSTQLFFIIFGILIFSLVIALIALHFIRESRRQVGREELTGLFNRRGFTERCERDPIRYDANNTANERAEKVSITASFGVTEASAADFSTGFDAVYQQADDLLYQAKNKGRNCVRTVHT